MQRFRPTSSRTFLDYFIVEPVAGSLPLQRLEHLQSPSGRLTALRAELPVLRAEGGMECVDSGE